MHFLETVLDPIPLERRKVASGGMTEAGIAICDYCPRFVFMIVKRFAVRIKRLILVDVRAPTFVSRGATTLEIEAPLHHVSVGMQMLQVSDSASRAACLAGRKIKDESTELFVRFDLPLLPPLTFRVFALMVIRLTRQAVRLLMRLLLLIYSSHQIFAARICANPSNLICWRE